MVCFSVKKKKNIFGFQAEKVGLCKNKMFPY